jgi:hypothetical protein
MLTLNAEEVRARLPWDRLTAAFGMLSRRAVKRQHSSITILVLKTVPCSSCLLGPMLQVKIYDTLP